jgi:type IV conjugative transfer system protein TraE
MNPLSLQQDSKRLYLQRNFLIAIVSVMLLSNLILIFCLAGKSERTIIIPAQLNQEVSFTGDGFSESYLEEMTHFFIGLLLDLTTENVGYKASILLKHVDPGSYQVMKKYFVEEEAKLKKYNFTSSFSITGMKIVSPLEREIEGILASRFGESGKKDSKVNYLIKYKNDRGRLLLEKFQLLGGQG